jgi:hypothetical protein
LRFLLNSYCHNGIIGANLMLVFVARPVGRERSLACGLLETATQDARRLVCAQLSRYGGRETIGCLLRRLQDASSIPTENEEITALLLGFQGRSWTSYGAKLAPQ